MAVPPIRDTYRSVITSATHGDDFQKGLGHALLLRIRKLDSSAQMAYEMSDADKFDDVVFFDYVGKEIHFIQAKHADSAADTVKVIDYKALIPTSPNDGKHKGDFDLIKYLKSYVLVIHRFDVGYAKYAELKKKSFYIFTNRPLAVKESDPVTFKEATVNEILNFSNPKAIHCKLTPSEGTIENIREEVNAEMITLKEAIKVLFKDGTVGKILTDNSTPLNEVLTIDNKKVCRFSSSFNSGNQNFSVAKLYNLLKEESFDLESSAILKNNFLLKKSRLPMLPSFVSKEDINTFFSNLTLSVGQPNDLRPIVARELKAWMKTWMWPDALGQLSGKELDQAVTDLKTYFDECNKHSQGDKREYLDKGNVVECLKKIQSDMEKLVESRSNVKAEEIEQYIEREITIQGGTKMSDTSFIEKLRGTFKDQQCIVLVADPGMGKTSLLKRLAFDVQKQELKQSYDEVFIVYLSALVKLLDRTDQVSDLDHVRKILSEVLSKENLDAIKNAPADRDSEGFSILIILDAFDEIHSKYSDKVTALIKQLSLKKSIQIIISARPHVQRMLEMVFNVSAMQLEPFKEEDKINYLRIIWQVSKDDDRRFQEYSKFLLDKYHTTMPPPGGPNIWTVTVVDESSESFQLRRTPKSEKFHSSMLHNRLETSDFPLIVRIIAEVYRDKFKQFVSGAETMDTEQFNFSAGTFNIMQLYEQFVRKYYRKKMEPRFKNIDELNDTEVDSMSKGYIWEHQLLAIDQLDIKDLNELLKNPSNMTTYNDFQERCVSESEKSLLVKVVNNKVYFCHLSFCEYFVAQYICDQIFSMNPKLVIEIWSTYNVIRNLSLMKMVENKAYFEMLYDLSKMDHELAWLICRNNCIKLVSSWKEKLNSYTMDMLRLMAFTANRYGNIELSKFLVDCNNDLHKTNLFYIPDDIKHNLRSSDRGADFRANIQLTLFLRLIKKKTCTKMAYDMKEADIFGDVVLVNDRNKEIHFLQIIYAEAKVDEPILMNELFPNAHDEKPSGDCDLFMWLKSYMIVTFNFTFLRYQKCFHIFTNRYLPIGQNDWVTIEKRTVNEIHSLSELEAITLKLTPNERAVDKIQHEINTELMTLKEAIKELFDNGTVSDILTDFSTPLSEVLTIDDKRVCRFSCNFNSNNTKFSVAKFWNLLNAESFDLNRTASVDSNFLHKKSKSEMLPPFVTTEEVEAFFRNLTLSVGYPNDTKPILDNELKAYLRGKMMPNKFCRLGNEDIQRASTELKIHIRLLSKHDNPLLNRFLYERNLTWFFANIEKIVKDDTIVRLYTPFNLFKGDNIILPLDYDKKPLEGVYIHRELRIEGMIRDPQDANQENKIYDFMFVLEFRSIFKHQQHMVLVADPDMGKTTFLNYVALTLQAVNVFLVNCRTLKEELEKNVEISDTSDVLKILSAALAKDYLEVIENAPNEQPNEGFSILLLLDELDEISPECVEKVIKMLDHLSLKKSVQFIISARKPADIVALKNRFEASSVFLMPIGVEDHIRNLGGYWEVENDGDVQSLQLFSLFLFGLIYATVSLKLYNIPSVYSLGTFLMVIAEIYASDFERFVSESKTNNELHFYSDEARFKVVNLYERFVEICCRKENFEDLNRVSSDPNDELNKQKKFYIIEHQLLALHLLGDKSLTSSAKGLLDKEKKFYRVRSLWEEKPKTSLLLKTSGDNVEFCHSSYRDYFVAKFLCNFISELDAGNIIRIWSQHVVIRNLSMLILDESETNFDLLFRLCQIEPKIAMWAYENYCLKIVSSWKENMNSLPIQTLEGMLEASARDGTAKLCGLIISCNANINRSIALDVATQNGHEDVVKILSGAITLNDLPDDLQSIIIQDQQLKRA